MGRDTLFSYAYGQRAVPKLAEMLSDKTRTEEERVQTLTSLNNLLASQEEKCAATSAIPSIPHRLEQLIRSETEPVRRLSADCLASLATVMQGRIAIAEYDIVPAMTDALRDKSPNVRTAAARALRSVATSRDGARARGARDAARRAQVGWLGALLAFPRATPLAHREGAPVAAAVRTGASRATAPTAPTPCARATPGCALLAADEVVQALVAALDVDEQPTIVAALSALASLTRLDVGVGVAIAAMIIEKLRKCARLGRVAVRAGAAVRYAAVHGGPVRSRARRSGAQPCTTVRAIGQALRGACLGRERAAPPRLPQAQRERGSALVVRRSDPPRSPKPILSHSGPPHTPPPLRHPPTLN